MGVHEREALKIEIYIRKNYPYIHNFLTTAAPKKKESEENGCEAKNQKCQYFECLFQNGIYSRAWRYLSKFLLIFIAIRWISDECF